MYEPSCSISVRSGELGGAACMQPLAVAVLRSLAAGLRAPCAGTSPGGAEGGAESKLRREIRRQGPYQALVALGVYGVWVCIEDVSGHVVRRIQGIHCRR